MTDTKISALASYTTPALTDVIPVNDVTNGVTKKAAIQDILNLAPARGVSTNKRTLCITGDSYAAAEVPSSALNTAARGLFRTFNAMLGNYFEVVNIATGHSGKTLAAAWYNDGTSVQENFQADVLAFAPAFAGMECGVNDVIQKGSVAGAAATMFAAAKDCIDRAVAAGTILMVLPVQMPGYAWGTVSSADQATKVATATLYNRLLLNYSMQKSGWIYFSKVWDGALDQNYVEPTFSKYLPDFLSKYRIDAVHFNHAGALRVANDMFNQHGALFQTPDVMPRHDADQGSACWNPMKRTTVTGVAYSAVTPGAGITGAPAQGWYARIVGTGAATVSQIARTTVAGAYWDQYVVTGLTPGSALQVLESSGSAFNYIYHNFSDYGLVAGDIVEFYFELKCSGVSDGASGNGLLNNLSSTIFTLTSASASVDTLVANINSGSTSLPYQAADLTGQTIVTSTVRYTIPATAAKWRVLHSFEAQSGGSGNTNFTVSVGRAGLRKIN